MFDGLIKITIKVICLNYVQWAVIGNLKIYMKNSNFYINFMTINLYSYSNSNIYKFNIDTTGTVFHFSCTFNLILTHVRINNFGIIKCCFLLLGILNYLISDWQNIYVILYIITYEKYLNDLNVNNL